jgi:hypothetical protein
MSAGVAKPPSFKARVKALSWDAWASVPGGGKRLVMPQKVCNTLSSMAPCYMKAVGTPVLCSGVCWVWAKFKKTLTERRLR